jgi:hypothetical protein
MKVGKEVRLQPVHVRNLTSKDVGGICEAPYNLWKIPLFSMECQLN